MSTVKIPKLCRINFQSEDFDYELRYIPVYGKVIIFVSMLLILASFLIGASRISNNQELFLFKDIVDFLSAHLLFIIIVWICNDFLFVWKLQRKEILLSNRLRYDVIILSNVCQKYIFPRKTLEDCYYGKNTETEYFDEIVPIETVLNPKFNTEKKAEILSDLYSVNYMENYKISKLIDRLDSHSKYINHNYSKDFILK